MNTRDTEFLSIPFDSLNDLLPNQVLQLLISYKLELAIVSTDLENSKNELNRLKRMNIMTAMPVPCLRQSSSPMMKTRPNGIKENISKYAEKERISDRSDRSVRLSSSSISANATRFSSDMLKNTANLMRFKTNMGGKRVGGGSVVGSVAGSLSSFLGGGGSVRGDDNEGEVDDDGAGSESGSVEGSVYSHTEYRRTRR